MTSPFQLVRLPFAEDVSAGEQIEFLVRQAAGLARSDSVNLPAPVRLRLLHLIDELETLSAVADMDALAERAMELA